MHRKAVRILGEKTGELAEMVTMELYGGVSFFLIALFYFIFMMRLVNKMMDPVYLDSLHIYLNEEGMRRLCWVSFGVNFAFFLLAGYKYRSLLNLVQVGTFPFVSCIFLQKLQENFSLAAVLALILGGLAAGYLVYLICAVIVQIKNMKKRNRRRKVRIVMYSLRKFRGMFSALGLVFCLITFAASFAGRTVETSRMQDTEDAYEEEVLWSNNKDKLRPLREENFSRLTPDEKLKALQGIVDLETAYLGIDSTKLTAEKMEDAGENGYFSGTNGVIVISDSLLQEDVSVEECLNTLLHECYHAYQLACVEEVDWDHVDTSLRLYREVAEWKKNFQEYNSASGYSTPEEYATYYYQSVEEDAREYAAEWTERYIAYIEQME